MTSNPTIIQSTAMPVQTIMPLAPGATSPMQSVQMNQQQQLNQQMALIGNGGGRTRFSKRRKSRKLRGGTTGVANNTQILVPSVQPGAVNSGQTAEQYAALTALASRQQSEAVYDTKNLKGGKRLKCNKRMKGGMWPVWGCLSGGRRTIRKNRKHRRMTRNTRNKRNKKHYK
jgi:hypothetical protein